jgi:predicted membrane-bound spermidine synthase
MIWAARFLSLCTGLLSLSQEILWVRFAGFAYKGAPQAFGIILGLYLLGIALGAGLGKRYCRGEKNLYNVAGVLLVIAAAFDMLLPWLASGAFAFGNLVGGVVLAASVVLTSLIKSKIFPIAHHLGSSSNTGKVGSSVSKVYFANIIGSTLGPLLTGFVLLQLFTLQQCFMLMAGLTLCTAIFCFMAGSVGRCRWYLAGGIAVTLALLFLPGTMIKTLAENTGGKEGPFKDAIENRYGIIHLLGAADGDDYVFGGNAYDGRINIDFMRNSNWISRLYMLAVVKPQPKRVLIIGMSAGSWTRVVSAFPGVEKIDVVEINPGYIELIRHYDEVKPLLSDPRLEIHYDDGRRWLKRHPDRSYDLVVMNTTFHWRAYITMLLSREFLEVLKNHMNPGAVLAYNSTYSWDVFKTASTVFGKIACYGNFVIAGDDFSLPPEDEAIRRVAALRLDNRPLVDTTRSEVVAKLKECMCNFEPYSAVEAKAGRPLEIITEQNMLTEYRYGKSIFQSIVD